MDIECRWPGSVHDRKVFANSSISMKMRSGVLSQTFQTLIPRLEKSQIILLETLHTLWHHTIWKNMIIVVFNNILRFERKSIKCATPVICAISWNYPSCYICMFRFAQHILQPQQRQRDLFLTWEKLLNLCYKKRKRSRQKRHFKFFFDYF